MPAGVNQFTRGPPRSAVTLISYSLRLAEGHVRVFKELFLKGGSDVRDARAHGVVRSTCNVADASLWVFEGAL